ncbi:MULTISPECIES: hypothetical protein [Rhizobium/Agrobacterium group]|uniref:hypothetical protein n=1 Tax=Rhizobium/Agrobacterium group TaxID=227290 RepID=UPI0004596604|nr:MULTISPECIES: hypothetical protein [Rhizobium/Agrobacterium group]CAD7039480.1 hypothetical protein RP007_04800 [Rhizobium sp. P007]CDN95397.1 hypothetical protein BN949_04569 [Agrobacterium tumefaciens]
MSEISVANGWQQILAEALAEARGLPPEWCFEIVKAETVDGALKISANYVSGDVPLDDHLPPDQKIPHPWRAMMRIREKAREKSLGTCECCGRPGTLVGADEEARVRCRLHEYVLDAVGWSGTASTGYMFDNPEAAMAHFLKDYGDGLDMMQELLAQQGRYKQHDPLDGSE